MKMNLLNVEINNEKNFSYPIIIGKNLFENAQEIICSKLNFKKAVIVTNTTVYDIYHDKFNFDAEYIVIEDGEEYKNIETFCKIQDELAQKNIERKDVLIALGGGVVGDIAGFAASTYMRGINFVQVPTTLLAQVDSSVGGKVAVNHKSGKNLIGAFYQPKLVLTDIDTLKTLDERQFKTGLGEILKYAFIEKNCLTKNNGKSNYPETLFEFLMKNKEKIFSQDEIALSELIRRCCELKANIVNADEKENGIRAILNFGHTFAHAIEKCTNFVTFTHGEAVSLGMKMAFDLSYDKKMIDETYLNEAKSLIDFYGLNYELSKNLSVNNLLEAISHDKKNQGSIPNFILAEEKGKCKKEKIEDKEDIRKIFSKYVS